MPSATTTEDLRRKFIVVQQQRSAPPNLALATNQHLLVPNYNPLQTTAANASSMMTTSTTLSTAATANVGSNTTAGNMLHEPERTYVFPGPAQPLGVGGSTNGPGIPGVAIISTPAPHTLGVGGRGHARSISHGGGGAIVSGGGRPIKSAMKGHQRAFSQGQITDSPPGGAPTSATTQARGHSRVGSKTDFILPPGHKDTPEQRDFGPSAPTSAAGRGHSRQASRSESIYTLRRTETPPWWKRVGFCQNSEKFEERTYRVVVPNHTVPPKTPKREHPNGQFVGNKIHTTKYTLLSFIPKNLFEQFHRVANLYFIFIVLLNWVPEVNAFAKEVAMIPVLFVLGVTAVKDLFEDRRRRASDKRINNTQCRVYDVETERYKKIKWQDLRVGDIVHLSNNEAVPADILFLRSSDPHGVCYIDTCDLDGETNLKRREVVRGYADKHSIFLPSKFVSRVEAEAPTTKLYRFHGALIHPTGERVPISTECLLLRESRLKNTDYIEGIVVYAGHETKSMLNNSGPRYKRSQVEQQMNIDVIWCMIILLILCVVGAVGYYMWLSSFTQFPVPYLPYKGDIKPGYEGYLTFWTYIIILQVMIPLSLYVTIELCKILQVYHIHNNIDLFDQDTNKKTECRAMNITEELGQIQHIFSDKTGTLTENKMIFRRCVINGIDYNHPPSELEKMCTKPGAPAPPLIANETLIDDMTQYLNAGQYLTSNAQRIQEFLIVLAICNTVIVSAAPHRDLMNASGIIEVQQHGSHSSPEKLRHKKQTKTELDSSTTNNTTTVATGAVATPTSSIPADRYTRLAESRSVTPSPPPNLIFAMPTQNHQPTLSPISSSAESTPTSESPPMKAKALANSISPTGRAKAVFNSKITSIATFLNVRAQAKRLKMNQAKQQPLYRTPDGRPLYEAESPDELALVNAAYTYDCCLFNRSPNHILVSLPNGGTTIEYEILKVLPFDSSRKCMSIVVRRTGTQEIVLYTKGADSSIMPVLAPCIPNSPEGILREKTQQQLDRYAREGLRILVMAKRVLNAADYTDWWARHQEIEMSLENRERRLRESFAKLESNLTLLGATGIEDRLQDNVPETIASLLAAGISVWVLTGDKPETAINIAYSAKLFTQQMELIRLTARSRDAAESGINCYLSDLEATKSAFNLAPRSKPRALVVDGKTLTFILDPKSKLIRPFLRLAKACASVLCCRSTPLQKAYLVKVVKEELNLRTLAIGDGANDVSMIQMADVGVGITGQEGMQAVMASDFTLSRFRYLEPLLLTHGYWCYDRLARMILYFFYKNAAFVFLIFWYQLYNGFSGQVMIDQMYLMLYNLIFTSLPPLAIGVYDKRVPEELLQKHPYLYKNGRMGLVYRPHDFWIVLLDALYQSLVIFFVALGAYAESDVGIWEFGATITASCLFTNLVHGAIEIRSWTILHVLSIVISLASFYLFSIIYHGLSWFGWTSTYFVIFRCFISAVHWLVIVLSTVVAVLPRLLFTTLQTSLYPDESSKVLLHNKRERSRGEGLLVTWSRSTSASSIYRITDYGSKNQIITSIT